MRIAALSGPEQKEEILTKKIPEGIEWIWVESADQLRLENTDACFDFGFTPDPARIKNLAQCLPRPVFINSVAHTLASINQPFIRINAWPGFFGRGIVELSVPDKATGILADKILGRLNWPFQQVADVPGLISARIIAMIINEAYYTFQEKISSKDEIDIAMKLGTNYPFGPFEWGRRIGLKNVYELLLELKKTDALYEISEGLIAEL